mgnify:FL=1
MDRIDRWLDKKQAGTRSTPEKMGGGVSCFTVEIHSWIIAAFSPQAIRRCFWCTLLRLGVTATRSERIYATKSHISGSVESGYQGIIIRNAGS